MNAPNETGTRQPPRPGLEPAANPLQEALALHRAGKHELAMQRYVAILQKEPANTDVLYYVAVLAIQEGQIDEGIKVINRALAVGKPQARIYNLLGQAHLRQNRDADAVAAFGKAIETDPAFADAYGNRGTLLAEMKRFPEALADLDTAVKLRPGNPTDLCNRAGVLLDLGRLDEALTGCDHALALMPNLAPALYNRAEIMSKLGRHAEALKNYDQAIAIFPDQPGRALQPRAVLKQMGRLDEARAAIERALALDPNSIEAITNRGNIAYEQGRLDDAVADYDRALKAQPELRRGGPRAGACRADAGRLGNRLPALRGSRQAEVAGLPGARPSALQRRGRARRAAAAALRARARRHDPVQPVCAAARRAGLRRHAARAGQPRRLLSTLEGVTIAGIEDAPPVNGQPTRWLPLMSAPGVLGVRPDNVPGAVPYLAAEPERVANRAAWLGGEGLRIGINWSIGAIPGWFGRQRDVPLAAFAPLAEIVRRAADLAADGPAAGADRPRAVRRQDRAAGRRLRRRRGCVPRHRGADDEPRPDRHLRHLGRASGGRARAAGAGGAPRGRRLAMAAGTRRHAVVSDHAAVPAGQGAATGAACSRGLLRRPARLAKR